MIASVYRPFRRVLVANRGEIALRVIRGAAEAGFETVAIASEPDAAAPHALAADRCVVIGAGPAADSYLDMDKVLAAAQETGADAIHPGYGFFAENPAFAQRVLEAGLVWIGPPPDVIRRLGDKVQAKTLARAAGVPTAPSYEGSVEDATAVAAEAERVGYPLLIKAAAGGGGRGMRVVPTPADLAAAIESAAREAQAAFGSGTVFLERYIKPARHVEVQIVADSLGGVVHLGERECSVQRRYQKIIEESPSPAVDDALREKMGTAAVALAAEAGYVGAGTVEFLLAPSGEFFFLEVNTRLQVEHPVTELVTGLDLVGLQLRAAAGESLGLTQDDVRTAGHSIELRVCAEDPSMQFAPQAGMIHHLELPTGPGVRADCGVRAGYEIPPHYDSLVLKLLAHGPDRETAIRRVLAALGDLVLMGPTTNAAYLRAILEHDEFRAARLSTDFIADHMADWAAEPSAPTEAVLAALAAELLAKASGGSAGGGNEFPTPWKTVGPWRSVAEPEPSA